jgi:hypothetical protein
MMLHQDGSRHAWLEGEPPLDLIVTLDDATGQIYSAFRVEEEEGTASTFRALKEVFGAHGLPMSLYTLQRSGRAYKSQKRRGKSAYGRACRRTSVAGLSSRRPTKTACRNRLSAVQVK